MAGSPANKTARVTESRATPGCGIEDKSTFVLIQVFLCAPGILEKNEPVWKNREPRQHPRNQMSWSPFRDGPDVSQNPGQVCESSTDVLLMMRKEIHGRSRLDQIPGTPETSRNSSRPLATSNHHDRTH
jgi:hypothetical protein